MKIRIKELTPETDPAEREKLNFYRHNTIFEGEVHCVQFCCYDKLVANPDFMQMAPDGYVVISYSTPNNISVEIDNSSTLWIRPKDTPKNQQRAVRRTD